MLTAADAYDLAFCDLDGTIFDYERRVQPEVLEAMREVIAAGKRITICTGRGYQNLRPFLEQVPVNAPLVLCNGSLIVDPDTREVLEVQPMPLDLAHRLMRLALDERLGMFVCLDDLETMVQQRPSTRGFTVERKGEPSRSVPDPFVLVSRPPHKVSVLAETPADAQRVAKILERGVRGSARVLTSSPRVVEVLLPGVSKARGMERVAAMLGVERARTLAVGDGDNDLEMLSWAGKGVAMGNATSAVMEAADWVAPSIDQNGLAEALRKFMIPSSAVR